MNLNQILDPRGVQERPMIELAKRPSLEELKNGKILFYNKTAACSINKISSLLHQRKAFFIYDIFTLAP